MIIFLNWDTENQGSKNANKVAMSGMKNGKIIPRVHILFIFGQLHE